MAKHQDGTEIHEGEMLVVTFVNRDLNVEKEAGRLNFVELYRESIQG